MRVSWSSRVVLGVGLFATSLGLGVTAPSCSDPGGATDAGADVSYFQTACSDGTIAIASCLASASDGAPAERFSDEACRSLDDAERRAGVTRDDLRAPHIASPAEGAVIPRNEPYTFVWHPRGIARRGPAWPAWISVAEAHCPPFNGVGYALVFRAGGVEVLRAETASTAWQPSPAVWARLLAAPGPLELRIFAARFSASNVTEGPVEQTTPRRFTIAP